MTSKRATDRYADFLDFLEQNPTLAGRLLNDVKLKIENYNGAAGDDGSPSPIFDLSDNELDRLVHEYASTHTNPEMERNDRDEDDESRITGKTWSM